MNSLFLSSKHIYISDAIGAPNTYLPLETGQPFRYQITDLGPSHALGDNTDVFSDTEPTLSLTDPGGGGFVLNNRVDNPWYVYLDTAPLSPSVAGMQEHGTIRSVPVCRREGEFILNVPQGTSRIHIPLSVTSVNDQAMNIGTVSDLYDALGAENVKLLITYDPSGGVWRSYLGDSSRGRSADRTLTDDMGIIASMNNPVTLRLKGNGLGDDCASQIAVNPGTSLIDVPLMGSFTRASDLLGLGAINSIVVSDNRVFKVVARSGDDGDIPITGGQSFIVTARAASVRQVTGQPWNNISGSIASAPPMTLIGHQSGDQTPVLAIEGSVVHEVPTGLVTGLHLTVKNLSTGISLDTQLDGGKGNYTVTFVDVTGARAAQVGDVLEITVQTPSPLMLRG